MRMDDDRLVSLVKIGQDRNDEDPARSSDHDEYRIYECGLSFLPVLCNFLKNN